MSLPFAYLGLLLVWSTTPLAVQWSNDSVSPHGAVFARLLFAYLLVIPLCYCLKASSLKIGQHWKLYLAAAIGLFPNMPLVYLAAEYIPSGLIALIFGTAPFMVAIFSRWLLNEEFMNARRCLAMLITFSGLVLLFREHWILDRGTLPGILLMLASVLFFAISAVLVKRFHEDIHPLTQVQGSLLFALPGLCLIWWVMDGSWPATISFRSATSSLYLATVGSVLGYLLYFHLLQKMNVGMVSSVTLISPMVAVWVGVLVNHEPMSGTIFAGTLIVLIGLAVFSGIFRGLPRWRLGDKCK